MNTVGFVGRAGSEPDLKAVGDSKVTKISMAVDIFKKGAKDTMWLTVEAWGKQAETLKQYVKKGDEFGVTGRLDQQKWTGQDGKEATKLLVVADRITLLSGNKNKSAGAAAPAVQAEDGMPF